MVLKGLRRKRLDKKKDKVGVVFTPNAQDVIDDRKSKEKAEPQCDELKQLQGDQCKEDDAKLKRIVRGRVRGKKKEAPETLEARDDAEDVFVNISNQGFLTEIGVPISEKGMYGDVSGYSRLSDLSDEFMMTKVVKEKADSITASLSTTSDASNDTGALFSAEQLQQIKQIIDAVIHSGSTSVQQIHQKVISSFPIVVTMDEEETKMHPENIRCKDDSTTQKSRLAAQEEKRYDTKSEHDTMVHDTANVHQDENNKSMNIAEKKEENFRTEDGIETTQTKLEHQVNEEEEVPAVDQAGVSGTSDEGAISDLDSERKKRNFITGSQPGTCSTPSAEEASPRQKEMVVTTEVQEGTLESPEHEKRGSVNNGQHCVDSQDMQRSEEWQLDSRKEEGGDAKQNCDSGENGELAVLAGTAIATKNESPNFWCF